VHFLVLLILSQIFLNQTHAASEPTPYDYYLAALDYEEANQYDDAMETFQYIVGNCLTDSIAGEAYQRIIDIYIQSNETAKAVEAVEQLKDRMEHNPDIYEEAYGYGLAQLYNYYYTISEEAKAEMYAKRLQVELEATEWIDVLKVDQESYEPTIEDLQRKIEIIRTHNVHSENLLAPMFHLSILLVDAERYEEAKEILLELKNWPDTAVVSEKMPEVLFQLGIVYEAMGRYGEALDVYQEVAFEYPDQVESFVAFKKIIDFNIAGGRVEVVVSMVEREGSVDWFGAKYDLQRARELYYYALLKLRDYYLEVGDQERAEYFEKKIAELE
jgi:tetratricopeptide (TPR) repeat protein